MLEIKRSKNFKKDLKKFEHQPLVLFHLQQVTAQLMEQKELLERHHNHPLGGDWTGYKECHIKPNILLIYRIDNENNQLILEKLESHTEAFK